MSDEKLKQLIKETIGNNDPYWNEPVFTVVKKIIDLPDNTECVLSSLVEGHDITETKFMFEIDKAVNEVCKKLNINLDKSKHAGQTIGLPFNISFVKKPLIVLPDNLKDYVYILNGDVFAKQKLPVELESEFEKFKRELK
ncbi:MAG: hypothetical protein IKX00_03900 [Bacilli bacterium]|nr:hypothetical protein [Bacilli bacterium]